METQTMTCSHMTNVSLVYINQSIPHALHSFCGLLSVRIAFEHGSCGTVGVQTAHFNVSLPKSCIHLITKAVKTSLFPRTNDEKLLIHLFHLTNGFFFVEL